MFEKFPSNPVELNLPREFSLELSATCNGRCISTTALPKHTFAGEVCGKKAI